MTLLSCVIVLVFAFLMGSVPWGLVISRFVYNTDIRDHGSGNIGTTNAIRTMGKVGGYAVFVLDFAKGIIPCLFAGYIAQTLLPQGSPVSPALLTAFAFIGCVYGHIFSPWLGFKGGKGIAVAVGGLFVCFGPLPTLLEIAVFAVLVLATRYVSVGSIAAAVLCPILATILFLNQPIVILPYLIAACTVIWAHRENIGRLRAGNENRIGDKKKEG